MFLLLRSGATLASLQQCLQTSANCAKCADHFSGSCLFPVIRSASVSTRADHCSGVYQNKNYISVSAFSLSFHPLFTQVPGEQFDSRGSSGRWRGGAASRAAGHGPRASQANPSCGHPGRCRASTTRPSSFIPFFIPSNGDLF